MSAWIEAGVYIGAILLIVVIVVVSHINSKPCKILSVEELEIFGMLDDNDEFMDAKSQALESIATTFGITVERMAVIVAETRTEVQAMLAQQRLTTGSLMGLVKKFDDLMLTKYGLTKKDRTPPER